MWVWVWVWVWVGGWVGGCATSETSSMCVWVGGCGCGARLCDWVWGWVCVDAYCAAQSPSLLLFLWTRARLEPFWTPRRKRAHPTRVTLPLIGIQPSASPCGVSVCVWVCVRVGGWVCTCVGGCVWTRVGDPLSSPLPPMDSRTASMCLCVCVCVCVCVCACVDHTYVHTDARAHTHTTRERERDERQNKY